MLPKKRVRPRDRYSLMLYWPKSWFSNCSAYAAEYPRSSSPTPSDMLIKFAVRWPPPDPALKLITQVGLAT